MSTRRLTTKQLSARTWPDFEWFFSQGNGWDHCGCIVYQGFRPPREVRTWADKRDWSLRVKCDLVERGRAHGILVYAAERPVGWCQFGPKGELPIQDRRRRSKLFPDDAEGRVWRITCFCTDKAWRERGVAERALRAALGAIRAKGGGLVESCPVPTIPVDPELDRLVRAHGGESPEVVEHLVGTTGASGVNYYDRRPYSVDGIPLRGLGEVTALVRRMAGALHPGTVALFERQGFEPRAIVPASSRVRPYSRVVMQRTV